MKDASADITAQLVAWLLGLISAAVHEPFVRGVCPGPGQWTASLAVREMARSAATLAGWS